MIHSHHSLLALILGVVLLSGYAQGQQSPTPDDAETKAIREKALKVLESVAAQINTLRSAENRARMGSNLVESLWESDEARARSLLRVVQEDITAELHKREPRTPADMTFGIFYKLRQDTIERLAKHDAEAAFEFFKATEPVFDENEPYELAENERALELQLAQQVASDNPEAALKLGRQSLERRFSYELLNVLRKLNRKHTEHAQILYKEIVEKFRTANLDENWEHRFFGQALLQAFPPPFANETTYRQLLGVFVTSALANGCADRLPEDDERTQYCRWLGSQLPQMEKSDPRAAKLRHWRTEDPEVNRDSLVFQELEELLQDNAFDELETLIAKYPEFAEPIRQRIYNKARLSAGAEEMRKIVTRFFPDPTKRAQLLAQFENDEKGPQMDETQLASLRARVDDNPHAYGKVLLLLAHVQHIRPRDQKIALKLLDEASGIIETLKPGKEQTEAQLSLAMMYCLQKSDRCFAIMETMVPKLNELVEMAVKLDGYDTDYLRDGEWNMSGNGSVGAILTGLSQQAVYFALFDFDRAVSLASQFERPEIRMMAHLKLAQSVLRVQPKPFSR